jgi:heterotetrameric sarcosine oxidase gamma subunit
MSSNAEDIKVESPLHYFHKLSSLSSHGKQSQDKSLFNAEAEFGLVLKEMPAQTHLNLRGDSDNPMFCGAVAEATAVTLPTEPGQYQSNGETSIYWLGPNEWLLVSQLDAANLEASLRQSLPGHIAVVDVSGGQTLVNLRGNKIAMDTVLKKSSVYDFAAWPEAQASSGRCVQTTFASASALFSNRPDGSFDLVIRRSFADYVAQWLLDAGQEFGCRIEG